MDATQEREFVSKKFFENLNELVKFYRTLLELLRKEKEVLILADIKRLAQINKDKEDLIYKIRTLDLNRECCAKELVQVFQFDLPVPRLLEIARLMGGAEGEHLRQIHATLDVLVNRSFNLNKENEEFTQSALSTLNGALAEIKGTLAGKPVYGQKGKMAVGPEKAGNFISKEV